MPWVEKVPRPGDFCGCPPCSLCYDYVDDEPPQVEIPGVGLVEQVGKVIEGFDKFCLDMTGKTASELPKPLQDQLRDAAEAVHKAKVKASSLNELPPALPANLDQEYDEKQREKTFHMQLKAVVMREKMKLNSSKVRQLTIDQLDIDVVVKALAPSKEKLQARMKEIESEFQLTGRVSTELTLEYTRIQEQMAQMV